MKQGFKKYHFYWILTLIVIIGLLFVDYNDLVNSGESNKKVTLPPDSSESSTSPKLGYDVSESEPEGREPYIEDIILNFPDSFSLTYPNIGSVQLEPADKFKDDTEDKAPEDQAEEPQSDIAEIIPSQDKPGYTFPEFSEITQFLENLDMDEMGSGQSAAISPSQLINTRTSNQVIIIRQEPDYHRVGDNNEFVQAKENSLMNNQLIVQVGQDNYAEQVLFNTFFSDLIIRSIGNSNTAVQDIINGYNSRTVITQNGSFNEAYQEIYSTNTAGSLVNTVNEVQQVGFSNWYRTFQRGRANRIDAQQLGDFNEISIEQYGNNNSATVRQNGSGNSATIRQN